MLLEDKERTDTDEVSLHPWCSRYDETHHSQMIGLLVYCNGSLSSTVAFVTPMVLVDMRVFGVVVKKLFRSTGLSGVRRGA
jgi:hypothetical protein